MDGRLICAVALVVLTAVAGAADKADRLLVEKSRHLLSAYQGKRLLGSWHVVFGPQPVGPKQQEGDLRTPEGHYVIDFKKPDSAYYKALHISYPNAADRARARRLKVRPGGNIMIHGQKNGFGWAAATTQQSNWTLGCIALSNEDMEQLWQRVEPGTAIEIRP